MLVSVLIPPSISLTYPLAFIRIEIAANNISLELILFDFRFNENINNKIIETNIWTINKDKKDFIQALNKIDVFLLHSDKKQNGDNKTKILISTYLIEYVITKFNNPNDINDFIIPSIENMFKLLSLFDNILFNFNIKFEKHIWVLNKFSQISLTKFVIKEIRYINSSQIKKEKFIQIAHKINLNINWKGLSTWTSSRRERINLIE